MTGCAAKGSGTGPFPARLLDRVHGIFGSITGYCVTMCLEMLAATDIGGFIERRPEIRGGRPVVAGTGVTVHRIAGWSRLGLSPEEIAENFGHVSLAQIHAALAYYHANRGEIERYLREEEEADPAPSPAPDRAPP